MNVPTHPSATALHSQVAIVGAGPIGIELAVALKRANLTFQIFDAGSVGQTISWWAPQTRWFSSNERIAICGVPLTTLDQAKATREQYLNYLCSVAQQFDLQIHSYSPVTKIQSAGDRFAVTANPVGGPEVYSAESVVLAIGGTDFPRKLKIEGEDLPHVDGYLREPHRYFGRRVLIIGGRNSAIEAALRLHHAGAQVSLSYRGSELPEDGIKYWLLPEIKGLLKAGRIANWVGTTVQQILPGAVRLRSVHDGSITQVAADDVLTLIGYEQDKTLLRSAGVQLTGPTDRPVYDEQTMQTNVPGIYVAGTATAGTQTSKYKTFLENCHSHVDKIVTHLTGDSAAGVSRAYEDQITAQPES
ncbi:NAD(P)-binding domain-containing protein [Stieleria sp. TO1_6]|uniref:NAD(P)-binding domain-containing protein n=1 Tax=Stieleria tagensis TaxID=2956795 RepID=UPI00209BACCE|nr:NAD(P)-binding domain-containing protein [Stieleria tagensis]MCO8122909.1 NAD(P)-binding domain-containing protein [Stieleria tagensis]